MKESDLARIGCIYIGNCEGFLVDVPFYEKKPAERIPLDVRHLEGAMFCEKDGNPFRFCLRIGGMKCHWEVAVV